MHYHADSFVKTTQNVVEMGLNVRETPDRAYHPTMPENLDGLFRDAADATGEQALVRPGGRIAKSLTGDGHNFSNTVVNYVLLRKELIIMSVICLHSAGGTHQRGKSCTHDGNY